MALDIALNTGAIYENGSGKVWITDSTAAGVIASAGPSVFQTGPLVKDSTISQTSSPKTKVDEGGVTYPAGTTVAGEFSGTYMQRDLKTYNLIKYMNAHYTAQLKELNREAVDGKFQYCYMPGCKGDGALSFKFPGGEIPFKLTLAAMPANVSIALGTYTFTGASTTPTGTLTVLANEFFGLIECT
jgi:hypothetical protein